MVSLADFATIFVYIPRDSYPATRLQPSPQVNQVDHVIVRSTCRSYRYTFVILVQWVPKQKVILIYKKIQGIRTILFRSSSDQSVPNVVLQSFPGKHKSAESTPLMFGVPEQPLRVIDGVFEVLAERGWVLSS